jgi:hypothetical protein
MKRDLGFSDPLRERRLSDRLAEETCSCSRVADVRTAVESTARRYNPKCLARIGANTLFGDFARAIIRCDLP